MQPTSLNQPSSVLHHCPKKTEPKPAAPQPLAAAVQSVMRIDSVSSTRVELSFGTSQSGSKTTGVEAYQAVESSQTNNPYASSILSFIQAQLQRDLANGASQEELQSRLQAGLSGFEKGFGEAFAQLSAAGILSDDSVRSGIEETRYQVLSGIQKLADQLGLELDVEVPEPAAKAVVAPASAAPGPLNAMSTVELGQSILTKVMRDAQIIERYVQSISTNTTHTNNTYSHPGKARAAAPVKAYGYQVSDTKQFSFRLRTAEGDEVTIKVNASQTGSSALAVKDGKAGLSLQGEQKSGLQFSVVGDLNEKEMQAIGDLLGQVGEVAEHFFAGNLDRAFELAGNIRFDREQVSSFSVDLTRVTTETAVVKAAKPQALPSADWQNSGALEALQNFGGRVAKAGDSAQQLGQPRDLVADLLDWVAQNLHADDARRHHLAPLARAYL